MTRINTNVSSITAQTALARTNADLQTALTRLSTGLRINSGQDDPAGLIAAENLHRDIVSVEKAISNSERASQIIATADSALGRVSILLNDIRGLVTEAANEGALSTEQIAANQLQIDASLEAIDRISRTTTFQGRRLLDGSLDFIVTDNLSTVADMTIEQANLGAADSMDVDIDITAAATQAEITNTAAFSAATNATATLNFAAAEETNAVLSGARFTITGTTLDSSLSGVRIIIANGGAIGQGNETAVYNSVAQTLTITIDSANTDAVDVVNAINDQVVEFSCVQTTGLPTAAVIAADAGTIGTTGIDSIAITASAAGPDFNNLAISVATDPLVLVGTPTADYDPTANTLMLTIHDDDITTLANIVIAINGLPEFSAVASGLGSSNVDGRTADILATANTDLTGGGTISADLVLQLNGYLGGEVFNFDAGASINQIVDAVNLVSDATGVSASRSGTTMTLNSTTYGLKAFITLEVVDESAGGTFGTGLSATRSTGTDIEASVNGRQANGDGNTLSINTATLDLSITVTDGSSTNLNFTIIGGGAIFQLGHDVVSNQQARVGISSVNTAQLGGVWGRLYELGSGEAKAVDQDAKGAARVADEVITKVAELRGRLGALQRTTLDSNIASLSDTLVNLTAAESSIRDADFAAETAALTRAQILVQAGTAVLQIANTNPQNVLGLLR